MESLSSHIENPKPKSLRDLCDDCIQAFPKFNESMFLEKIKVVLGEESIRTRSVLEQI